MPNMLSEPVKKKDTLVGSANNLYYGASGMQGWRNHMEDDFNMIGSLNSDLPNISLFGVYDGKCSFVDKFSI